MLKTFLLLLAHFCVLQFVSRVALAQTVRVEPPDKKYLFIEDRLKEKREDAERKALRAKKKRVESLRREGETSPFDIQATSLNYDSNKNLISAEGNLLISYGSSLLEARRGTVDMVGNRAQVSGDVLIDDVSSSLQAESADVKLDDGTATLFNSQISSSDGDFRMRSSRVDKISDETYELEETSLTTCRCPERGASMPWCLKAAEGNVTENGYGEVWDAWLTVHDRPLLYFPYLFFPVKTERQSGFLPARFGTGRRSGLDLEVPFFWAIDNSTDLSITGLLESQIRVGADTEFRKAFSRENNMDLGVIYLNESERGDDMLGTNTDGLDDPTFDKDRLAGYWAQIWREEIATQPVQMVIDGRYVSDDLFLREYDKDEIGDRSSRYVTSRASIQTPVMDTYSFDVTNEWNQSLVSDDDFVFQRLPQVTLGGFDTFRPFPVNPYGLKLVLNSQLDSTTFSRKESYDGTRSELYEKVRLPFHYWNYMDGELALSGRGTLYSLAERDAVNSSGKKTRTFDAKSDRLIPRLDFKLGSVLERVYAASEGNLIKKAAELGQIGRGQSLVRVKHTIEPLAKYLYVPQVDQDDTPQFDSNDRLAQRNVVTYGLMQRLFARYEPRNRYLYGIEETAPEFEDLEQLRAFSPLDPIYSFGFEDAAGEEFQRLQLGQVRELANLFIGQSFDIDEDRNNLTEDSALSDLDLGIFLFPNEYVLINTSADYNIDDYSFSAYTIGGQLRDKRGDQLRSRLRFVEESIRQLESGLEVGITDNLRLGYYSLYDDLEAGFIENKFGLRILSSCKCWIFDVEVSDKINPDETKLAFNITLVGLGEIGNTFFSKRYEEEDR